MNDYDKIKKSYDNNLRIAAISFNKNISFIACFLNNEYCLYPPIYDDYLKSKSKKILNNLEIKKILLHPSENIKESEMFLEFIIKYCEPKRQKIKFSKLSLDQINVLQILRCHLNHQVFFESVNKNIIGYIDKYPVKLVNDNTSTYVEIYHLYNLNLLGKNSELLQYTITSFGKEILESWIKAPLNNIEDLKKRKLIQDEIISFIPKIKKLLKKCKIKKIEKKVNFKKLKNAMKSALILSKLLNSTIKLENQKKYKKVYKILKIFENNSIIKGVDTGLDKLIQTFQNIPIILNEISYSIYKKHRINCKIVFIPEIGFLIETDSNIGTPVMIIKDKKYFKSNEMKNLDFKIGKIYEKIKEKTVKTNLKIEQKILKINFNYFYNFIGEIDAYCALLCSSLSFKGYYPLYFNTSTEFMNHYSLYKSKNPDNLHSIELDLDHHIFIKGLEKYSKIKLLKNSIILDDYDIIKFLAKNLILGQIGCKINCEYAQFKIFDKIFIKIDDEKIDIKKSSFLKELEALNAVLMKIDSRSICLIQDVGHYTDLEFGYGLFKTTCDYLNNSTIIISTKHIVKEEISGYQKYYCVDKEDKKEIIEHKLEDTKIYDEQKLLSADFIEIINIVKKDLNQNKK